MLSTRSEQADPNGLNSLLTTRRFALGGIPYTINFYLDHGEGSSAVRNRIGRVYNFSSAIGADEDAHCTQCLSQSRANVKASGSIPLTNLMIKKAQDPDCPLFSLKQEDTVEYLKKHLNWEVTDVCSDPILNLNPQIFLHNTTDTYINYQRSGTVIQLDPAKPFIEVSVTIGTPDHVDPLHVLSEYHDYTIVSEITKDKVGGIGYVHVAS